jgi:hypothetical protein
MFCPKAKKYFEDLKMYKAKALYLKEQEEKLKIYMKSDLFDSAMMDTEGLKIEMESWKYD